MKRAGVSLWLVCLLVLLPVALVHAEILALVNYETKPEQTLRKEGLAVLDVDPQSSTFGKILCRNATAVRPPAPG